MKKYYYVISIQESSKNYAFADTVKDTENLVPFIERYRAKSITPCKSRTEAEKLALFWNECYKNNGTYLY